MAKKQAAERSSTRVLTPEKAVGFLEDFRKMQAGKDEARIAISLRVPKNIIRAYKTIAAAEGRPYQTIMQEALREHLRIRGK